MYICIHVCLCVCIFNFSFPFQINYSVFQTLYFKVVDRIKENINKSKHVKNNKIHAREKV